MTSSWHVLLMPEATRVAYAKLRTQLFRETGELTLRMLPPVVFLYQSDQPLPDYLPCPDHSACFEEPVIKEGHLLIPVSGLEVLQKETMPFCYIGDIKTFSKFPLPDINDFRVATLTIEENEHKVTWLLGKERRLWKGKAKRQDI